jgi:hypothetical protein
MIELATPEQLDAMRPTVREFYDKFVKKHNKTSTGTLIVNYVHLTTPECGQLSFYDTRYTHPEAKPVFTVSYKTSYTRGKDYEYVIWSERISNAKFAQYNSDHYTQSTKDVNKAVSIALKYSHARTWWEIAKGSQRDAQKAHQNWESEPRGKLHGFGVTDAMLYKELRNLVAQGVTFITSEFNKSVLLLDEYAEWENRVKRTVPMRAVIEEDGKFYMPEDIRKGARKFESLEDTPEELRGKLSMLKLMGEGFVPEVGYRAADGVYWVYVSKEEATKLTNLV